MNLRLPESYAQAWPRETNPTHMKKIPIDCKGCELKVTVSRWPANCKLEKPHVMTSEHAGCQLLHQGVKDLRGDGCENFAQNCKIKCFHLFRHYLNV